MDIHEIDKNIILMADKVYGSLLLIEKGFMENKLEYLSEAMEEEHRVNDMERMLTKNIVDLSKSVKKLEDKKKLVILAQVIETLEHMGDEATNIIERIEIKVSERLLFSEIGVEQFMETFDAMKKSVENLKVFLSKPSVELKDKIIDNGFHVKGLVERYRKDHFERLVQGLCTPIAANMFFDVLDFTGNLARHSSNIVKLY